MRVLLRDTFGHYYAGPGDWTSDRSMALDMNLVERAIQENAKQNLGATHVVLAYDTPACNLAFPISNYSHIANLAVDGPQEPNPQSTV